MHIFLTAKLHAESTDGFGYFKYADDMYWSNFPIVRISKDFNKEQREILWEASYKAQDKILSEEVSNCIRNNVTSGYYEDETPVEAVQRFALMAPKIKIRVRKAKIVLQMRRQQLFIHSAISTDDIGSDTAAFAHLGSSRENKSDMNIYIINNKVNEYGLNFWAGVIVHEILHVLSYSHPEAYKDVVNSDFFKGNLVFEAGWCISGSRE